MLIILFTILVVILRAWKNLISDGFKPVGPFLITTSLYEVTPTLALHGIVNPSTYFFIAATDPCVKIKATLFLIKGTRFLSYGNGFHRFFLNS